MMRKQRVRRWILQYLHSCQILLNVGERAWPWNVPVVWKMAGENIDAHERLAAVDQ